MKWLRSLILILVLIAFTSYGERTEVDPWDLQWCKLYPDWYTMPQDVKDTLQRLYELSPNKANWFPDLHEARVWHPFTIYPRSRYLKENPYEPKH